MRMPVEINRKVLIQESCLKSIISEKVFSYCKIWITYNTGWNYLHRRVYEV